MRLSLEPDPWMRWIYENNDPRYHDPATQDLRDRRDAALRSAPKYMIDEAEFNDAAILRATPTGGPP